jgi:Gpi18-like mannosyltransferase
MNKKNIIYILIVFFILGLLIRIYGLRDTGFYFDTVETQYQWSNSALAMGFSDFWKNYKGFMDYLPGSVFFGMIIKNFSLIINNSPESYVLILKIINIFSDIGLSIFVYFLLLKKFKFSQIKSIIFSLIIFLAPGVWFISSYWGQFDNLIVLLTLVSFYFLTFKSGKGKNFIFSGLIYGLAISLKLQPVIFSFLVIIYLISNKNLKDILKYLSGFFISFVGVNIIPLIINSERTVYVFSQPFLRNESISVGANNFWMLFPNLKNSGEILIGGLSVSTVGSLIFVLIVMLSLIYIFKLNLILNFKKLIEKINKNYNFQSLLLLTAITNLAYFLFMTKMHSRYDNFATILIIVLIALAKKSIGKTFLIFGAICLNASYFLNQLFVYYSWYKEKLNYSLEIFMNNQTVINTLVILNIVALLSILIFAVKGNKSQK